MKDVCLRNKNNTTNISRIIYASFTYLNTIVCNTVIKRNNTLFFTFDEFIKTHDKHFLIFLYLKRN